MDVDVKGNGDVLFHRHSTLNLLVDVVGLHPHLEHSRIHDRVVALQDHSRLAHVLYLQRNLRECLLLVENQVHDAAYKHLLSLQEDPLAPDGYLFEFLDVFNGEVFIEELKRLLKLDHFALNFAAGLARVVLPWVFVGVNKVGKVLLERHLSRLWDVLRKDTDFV